MRAHRARSSNYLVSGFAISMALVAAIGSIGQTQAQVDPNLQATIDVFSPPLVVQSPPIPEVKPEYVKSDYYAILETGEWIPIRSDRFKQLLATKIALRKRSGLKAAFADINKMTLEGLKVAAQAYYPVKFGTKPQPTQVKVSFPTNPTYESNVLKSNQTSPGGSMGFGGNVQVTGPGAEGRPFDLVAFSAGSASARYLTFPTKSFDAFTVQGFYQFFIDAYEGNGTLLNPTNPKGIDQGMITVETLAIGFQNQTSFAPTYRTETADLFTPQIVFSRQNINLSGDTSCTPIFQPDPAHPRSFCYYANFALTAGQTFSDVAALQNANVAASATVGRRFDHTDFVLSLTTTATGRTFEDVPGGRQDLLLQIGPTLTYVPSSNISVSLAVTYNQNYSSLAIAAWHGVVVQPTLTIAFPVPTPVI